MSRRFLLALRSRYNLSLSISSFSLSLWQPNDDKKLCESDRQRNWRVSNYGFSDGIFLWRIINRRRGQNHLLYIDHVRLPEDPLKSLTAAISCWWQSLETCSEWVFEEFVRSCFTTCRTTRLTFQRADIVMLTLSPRMQANVRLSFISVVRMNIYVCMCVCVWNCAKWLRNKICELDRPQTERWCIRKIYWN